MLNIKNKLARKLLKSSQCKIKMISNLKTKIWYGFEKKN